MQYIFITLLIFSLISLSNAQQRVGIGLSAPAAKLDIRSVYSNPTIPGTTSTGVLRIGVSDIEAIDIGKMGLFPFAGWIQSGFNNSVPDPLLIQPLGGAVAIGNSNPAQSAAFEVTSTSKGLLPPRMTLLNRMSITNPAEGLVVWCTDCGIYGQMQVFNGVIWTDMAGHKAHTTPVIGDHDGGGIIAYIFQPSDPGYVPGETHGIITTPNDNIYLWQWGCTGINVPGAEGWNMGTGAQNTLDIQNANCADWPYTAAKVCTELTHGGYTDWVLPSGAELQQVINHDQQIGGFTPGDYWSSTEFDALQAIAIRLPGNGSQYILKTQALRSRCTRNF